MKKIMLLFIIFFTNFAMPTWAAETATPHDMSKMSMKLSKEDREKMATAHAKMATCLRSDQEVATCHDALRKECQSLMGGSCSGMEAGKSMHKGMKHKE